MATAAYDEIADWYEEQFLSAQRAESGTPGHDPLGIDRALRDLLGDGSGTCLEIGCGTGVHSALIRDAGRLPVRNSSVPAVAAVMVHTDMPGYPAVLHEVARVLRPGGVFVHVGVHPCFCGGFADRSNPEAVVIEPGYLDGHWTKASWSEQGVRAKVGATHWPLPALMHAFLDAGLTPERFTEGGAPVPVVLAVRARKRQ